MAVVKKYSATLPVQLTPEWKARVAAVADHPAVLVGMAEVVRDCIEAALPGIELQLGIRTLDDLSDDELMSYGVTRVPQEEEPPRKENRAAGCFGGPPLPKG
jgi:hypothetical protein